MKKSHVVIRSLVVLTMIAAFMACFMACASTTKQEGTGEYFDDSVITGKIKTLLASDDFLKSFSDQRRVPKRHRSAERLR